MKGYADGDGMGMKQGGSAGPTTGPMNTNKGKHPGVKRIFKAGSVKQLTSKKSQQMNGAC
jgi:hypothetical protein